MAAIGGEVIVIRNGSGKSSRRQEESIAARGEVRFPGTYAKMSLPFRRFAMI
jgi:hypothetical protein